MSKKGFSTPSDALKYNPFVNGSMQTLESDAMLNFVRGIDSHATRQIYVHSVKRMLKFASKTPEELLKMEAKELEDLLMDYITFEKNNGVSRGLIRVRLAAAKKFFKRNRKTLDWDIVSETIGKGRKVAEDRAYTHEEIHKAVSIAHPREKVIMLLMASTGMRRGALPLLRKGDLKPVENLYKIIVYRNDPEQYFTFCTPECRQAIDDYFAFRAGANEKIKDTSFVIRTDFSPFRPSAVNPRPVKERIINDVVEKCLVRASVRKRIVLTEGVRACKIRHEVKITHGFRKFFDTQMTLSGVSELYTQLLEGHEIGLKGAYLRPTEIDLLKGNDRMRGYVDAIDTLTISEENRQKKKIVELERDKSQWGKYTQKLEERIAKLEKKGLL